MVALRVAFMNSAMSGRPIAASSAATTVSNGLDDVMVSRSISISRTVMDWRFRRRRYRSDANESVYDDCHVIMAAQKLSVNRLFRVETITSKLRSGLCKIAHFGKNNPNQAVSITAVRRGSGWMVVDKDVTASANP